VSRRPGARTIISAPDAPSIYEVPLVLHREGLDTELARHLGIEAEPELYPTHAFVSA